MDKVTAITKKENYRTEITSDKHSIIADEPKDLGGTDLGMNPGELLCSSLAACTSITLRMYANRKEWNLEQVNVEVSYDNSDKENSILTREILVQGQLEAKEVSRLESIANACPMHKLLSKSITIKTTIQHHGN